MLCKTIVLNPESQRFIWKVFIRSIRRHWNLGRCVLILTGVHPNATTGRVYQSSQQQSPQATLSSLISDVIGSYVDLLDRVLDKGLVVAGDIKVSLAEVELLTIRIRLLICSIDKAEQIGLDWWKFDHHLSPGKHALSAENEELKREVRLLERKLASLSRRRSALK